MQLARQVAIWSRAGLLATVMILFLRGLGLVTVVGVWGFVSISSLGIASATGIMAAEWMHHRSTGRGPVNQHSQKG